MTGYLTAVQNTTVPNGRLCQLKIPNEELTYVFQSEVLNLEPFSKSKSSSISLNSSRSRYPHLKYGISFCGKKTYVTM